MCPCTYLCPTATTSFMMLLDTFLLRKSITVSMAATWSLMGTCRTDGTFNNAAPSQTHKLCLVKQNVRARPNGAHASQQCARI